MVQKVILNGSAARAKLIKGADFLADCVKSTLGPFGANAAIEKGKKITNDGVTIAREIVLKDEIENRGADILREAAIRANDEAGDGTTTAITLAQAITKEAIKFLGSEKTIISKKKPIEVIRQIQKEREEVDEKLKNMAINIASEADLIDSARVSAEDENLAQLIGKTQWELGLSGYIIVEESNDRESSIQRIKGVRIDNGLGTSLVITNEEKQTLDVLNTRIVLTNHVIQGIAPLKPVFDQLAKSGVKDVVLMARAFTREAIMECMENMKVGFNIYPLNAPYVDQNEILKDLAAVLGGNYINQEEKEISDIQLSDIGFAEKISAGRYEAIFTGLNTPQSEERVRNRILELQKKHKGEASVFEKKNIEARIAQLTSGFAILRVGATSETERSYKKDKAEDAVNAVRAAFQEGVVPGAGLAFKTISEEMDETYILKRPLMSVYEQIMSTAPADFQIDPKIKDPVKVLRIALEKACSVASTFATTSIAIATENPKPRLVEEVKTSEETE